MIRKVNVSRFLILAMLSLIMLPSYSAIAQSRSPKKLSDGNQPNRTSITKVAVPIDVWILGARYFDYQVSANLDPIVECQDGHTCARRVFC